MVCRQDHKSLAGVDTIPLYSGGHLVTQDQCDQALGCGLPSYSFRDSKNANKGCLWIPTDAPQFLSPTSVNVVSINKLDSELTNITVTVSGPSRIMLLVTTKPGAKIHEWSLGDVSPGQHVHHAQLITGHGDQAPQHVWLVVRGWSGGSVIMTATGHYNSGPEMVSGTLRQFSSLYPTWVSIAGWTVDYKYYTF